MGKSVQRTVAIKSVRRLPRHQGSKYDLTIAKCENFFASGVLVHNCRCMVRFVDGAAVAISREGTVLKVPHITAMLTEARSGDDVVLDGELYCHGMTLNKIGSLCKRLQPDTEKVRLHLYDAVLGVAYAHRYAHIKEVAKACDKQVIDLVKTVKVRTVSDLDVVEADCIEEGYEGAMLRFGRMGYQPGQRSPYLLKCKRFDDTIFEVVDYKFGRGKYADIPVFVCATEAGNLFDVTAPGDLEEKRVLGADVKSHIGRKLKVKHAGMTNTAEPKPFQPVALEFVD